MRSANIIKTKQPGKEWSDVIEISDSKHNYKTGQIVKLRDCDPSEYGTIFEFEPSKVKLVCKGDIIIYAPYSHISPVGFTTGIDGKIDPNRAFVRKRSLF